MLSLPTNLKLPRALMLGSKVAVGVGGAGGGAVSGAGTSAGGAAGAGAPAGGTVGACFFSS